METNVTELPDSRARVEVSVPADEVDKRVRATAQKLGGEMKIPGFRKGKVPPEMVLQRLGRQTVLSEALESSLGDWYERALLAANVNPVGDPKLDLTELPDAGEPLQFAIEVAVRPSAELGDYKGLEVGRNEAEVPDYLLEIGAGRVLPDFEEAVKGAKAGDQREATVEFPADYQGEEVAGKTAQFTIDVREVREKELPELDDDFAAEASEFETIDELRTEIRGRMEEYLEGQTREHFREAALDAAVANATVDIPDEIVKARAGEMWERIERRLRQQGMEPSTYLQMQGKTREEVVEEARPDASRALKREAVLEAVADAEGIEVTEDDMLDALQIPPGHEDHGHPEPEEALKEIRASGRENVLKEDLRMRKALDLIAESAKPIPMEQAEAREAIWTPEKEREEKAELWTPGD